MWAGTGARSEPVRHHDDRRLRVLFLFFKKNHHIGYPSAGRRSMVLRTPLLGLILVFLGAAAPPAPTPVTVSQSLVDYLLRPDRDIATDKKAQTKFLAASLRLKIAQTNGLIQRESQCKEAGSDAEPLGNETLLQASEPPTRCDVGAAETPDPAHAEVPLHCLWLEGTNYPGLERNMRFYLIRESEQWLVEDIKSFATHYNEESTVIEDLGARQRAAATALAACPAPASKK